ncbi:hypothetical protein ACU5DF_10600 [Aliivibrio wodanis]|uniref:hypothetical protein n=1 Tax=Aliivibrio wodanis TaxID=80852 RepID=UPI00406C7063
MNLKQLLFIILSLVLVTGCISNRDEGFVWCNARYLDLTNENYQKDGSINPQKDKSLRLAKEGYLYAVAGSVVLQKPGEDEDRHFNLPPYMVEVINLQVKENDDKTGFQASTFEIYTDDSLTTLEEVVISFRGSDEWNDWAHNLKIMRLQFNSSENYINKVITYYGNKLNDKKLVAVGFSLGGGLAMKAIRVNPRVDEVWAFNTSPVDGEGFSVEENQYTLSVKGEILSLIRWFPAGPDTLGSLDEHHYADYDLIHSNPISAHARWGLTRQLLILADMVYFEESGRKNISSPPLKILKGSPTPRGCKDKQMTFLKKHDRI